MYVCMYREKLYKYIALMGSFFQWPGTSGFNPNSSHTNDLKMVLDTSLLNNYRYKARIKGKVEQSRERRSALFFTLE